jgi:hypothetical protein
LEVRSGGQPAKGATMKKGRFDKRIEKKIIAQMDNMAKAFSMADVRHAAGKLLNRERVKASVAKERARLNARLAELESK